jgi:hypothetical protein
MIGKILANGSKQLRRAAIFMESTVDLCLDKQNLTSKLAFRIFIQKTLTQLQGLGFVSSPLGDANSSPGGSVGPGAIRMLFQDNAENGI